MNVVVLSTQHDPDVTQEQIHRDIKKYIFDTTLPKALVDEKTKFFINPTGRFVIGGPNGDSGLTCLLYTSKEDGLERFIEIENEVNCGIQGEKSVIATGGSVIYGKEAMEHLRKIGQIIYLRLPYEVLNSRLHNLKGRGVALKEGQTLKDLYEERCPLYEKYAHFILDTENLDVEETISEIEKLTKN